MKYLDAQAIQQGPAEYRIGVAADGSAAQVRQVLDDLHRQGIDVHSLSLHSASL